MSGEGAFYYSHRLEFEFSANFRLAAALFSAETPTWVCFDS